MRPSVAQLGMIFLCGFVLCACHNSTISTGVQSNVKSEVDSILDDLLQLCHNYPDSAKIVMSKMLTNNSLKSDSNFYFQLVNYYGSLKYNLGEIDSSKYYLIKAKDYWQNVKTSEGQYTYGVGLYNLAFIALKEGKNEESIDYFNKSVDVAT